MNLSLDLAMYQVFVTFCLLLSKSRFLVNINLCNLSTPSDSELLQSVIGNAVKLQSSQLESCLTQIVSARQNLFYIYCSGLKRDASVNYVLLRAVFNHVNLFSVRPVMCLQGPESKWRQWLALGTKELECQNSFSCSSLKKMRQLSIHINSSYWDLNE